MTSVNGRLQGRTAAFQGQHECLLWVDLALLQRNNHRAPAAGSGLSARFVVITNYARYSEAINIPVSPSLTAPRIRSELVRVSWVVDHPATCWASQQRCSDSAFVAITARRGSKRSTEHLQRQAVAQAFAKCFPAMTILPDNRSYQ